MVTLSVLIFTSTVSVLVSIQEAPSSFAASNGYVVSSPGAPTVFSSSVDAGLAEFFASSSIQAASPEVFAFSSYNGVPFVVRGVELPMLAMTGPAFSLIERIDNGTNLSGDQALVGIGLMNRLGLGPPSNITITASYQSRFEVLQVIGWFKSSSALDDEVLVSLDKARSLSGMSGDKVSIVRLASLRSDVRDALTPFGPRFAIYDFTASKSHVIEGREVVLSVSLKNWGTERGAIRLSFYNLTVDPRFLLYNETILLDSGAEMRVALPFTCSQWGVNTFGVSIAGVDNQSLDLSVAVVSWYSTLSGPSVVALNSTFEVTVIDSSYSPVDGAVVRFLNQTVSTNASGIAALNATELGSHQALSSYPGPWEAYLDVLVYDPSASPNEFKPNISEFTVVPNTFKEAEKAQVRLTIENAGQKAGVFTGTILLDGSAPVAAVSIPLMPGESKVALYPLNGIAVGEHALSLGAYDASFIVYPWYSGDPDLIMLAVRYGGTLQISTAGSIPIVQAAKLSQGDIEVALVSVGGISGTLASLSMTSIFSKEIHEGRDKLGILRTLGASRSVIRRLVIRQSLAFSFPSAVTGIVLGLGVSALLLRSKWLMMFGHSLQYNTQVSVAPWILIGTILICLASSIASAQVAARSTPIASIRKTEDAQQERRTVDEVLGDE